MGDRPSACRQGRILNEPISIDIAVSIDPVNRPENMWLKSPVDVDVAGPVEHLGRKPDEKRRGIDRPVIGNMGHFLQPSHFAVSHLMEDLSRSLIGEWVDVFTLQRRKEVKSL